MKGGALPVQVLLPPGPITDVAPTGEKVGADDWLLANSPKGDLTKFDLKKFEELERIEFSGAEKLWELNKTYAYIYKPVGHIMRIEADGADEPITLMRMEDLRLELKNRKSQTGGEDSFLKQLGVRQDTNLADTWAQWAHRAEYQRIDYVPGETKLKSGAFNVWRGYGIEPVKGDIAPLLKLLKFIFGDSPAWMIKWFLQWLAWPLQHPGKKTFNAVLLIGPFGSGKNLIAEFLLRRIYGRNYILLGPDRPLNGRFNTDLIGRQFACADEVFVSDKRELVNLIKAMITRTKIRIEGKGVNSYEIGDVMTWLFLTNDGDAIHLEDNDRRWFIRRMPITDSLDRIEEYKSFANEFVKWAENGGAAAAFHYLLNDVDCSDFEWNKAPRTTPDKAAMIVSSRGDVDTWAHDLINENYPESLCPLVSGLDVAMMRFEAKANNQPAPWAFRSDLFELGVLKTHFAANWRGHDVAKTPERTITNALTRAGAVALPMQVRLRDGRKRRIWSLRKSPTWLKASTTEIKQYLNRFVKEKEEKASNPKSAARRDDQSKKKRSW